MNIKKLLTIVGIAVILVATLPVGSAFAQGPIGTTTPMGAGGRRNWGGPQNSLVAVAAKTIGIDQAALVAELNTSKTIATVAAAHDVALDKIVDAFVAPHIVRWNQAVAAGVITQAQADAFITTLKVNVMNQLNAPFTPNGLGTGFVDANGDSICDVGGRQPQTMPRGRWAR